MTVDVASEVRRGRAPRNAETEQRRERRRREGDTETIGLKLPIPDWVQEKYPTDQFEYRWFRGTPARLHEAHKNDWDVAEGGDGNRIPGAIDEHERPVDHVLHVKYRDWYEKDRAPKEAARRETEEQMRRGEIAPGRGDDGSGAALTSDISYASANNRLA